MRRAVNNGEILPFVATFACIAIPYFIIMKVTYWHPPTGLCHVLQDFLSGFILTLVSSLSPKGFQPALAAGFSSFSLGLRLRPNTSTWWRLGPPQGDLLALPVGRG
jgi:hypothetical protein